MATVQLIDGRIVENVKLTDVRHVGEEGSRSAIAHIDGKTYEVYNSIVDGFNNIWHEQMSWETYKMLGKKGFVEGSVTMDELCDYPGCNEAASVRCSMIGCNHHVCETHGNGGYELSPEEFVPICWGCDGKGWSEQ